MVGALALLCIGGATVAGFTAVTLYDARSGTLQPGPHPAGEIEAMSAARLGVYFFAFQLSTILLTLLSARFLRRWVQSSMLALTWPRGGLAAIAASVVGLLAIATAAGLAVYAIDKAALASDLRPFAELARSRAWWVLLLAAGVGAPVAEELLFRGFLFSGLRSSPLGFYGTAVVTTLFWTSLHATYSPYGLALVFLIGMFFALLRERTGSIISSITAHAVYNSSIVVALMLTPESALG